MADAPAWVNADRALERGRRDREHRMGLVTYRIQCAAFPNGCLNWLAWEGEPNADIYRLDELVWADRRTARLLSLNGWRLDHGRWICGHHGESSGLAQPDQPVRRDTNLKTNPEPLGQPGESTQRWFVIAGLKACDS